jgi:peptide/nickel transport system substrate-binding protein
MKHCYLNQEWIGYRRNQAAWIYAFGLLLYLSGCYTPNNNGKQIFRYNEQTGIASLDPAFAKNQSIMWASHQLYSTLTEAAPSGEVRPLLARSWTISNNNTLFTFYLRSDVYFHDDPVFVNGQGRRLVASDLVYSFHRLMDKATASPGAWIFNNKVDTVEPFVAINDSTFQLRLLRPFQPILGILSMQYCAVVPREAVEHYGNNFRRHPVGTGPFVFTAWEEGQALILKKNHRYFERDSAGVPLPYLDGIHVSFFDSKATEFLEFTQQRLDFINDIDASFKDEVLTKTGTLKKEWQQKVVLQKHPYLNIEYLGILTDTSNPLVKNSPLRQKKLRQAINYAFDRRKLMLYLRNSIGTPAESGFVPKGLPGFSEQAVPGYTYQPQRAAQLLQEAGFGKGNPMPTVQLVTIPVYADLATFIANELRQHGISLQVETVQKSLLLEQTAKSQVLFFRGSWIADYPDAENYLGVFYGKNPVPPNYTRFKNAQYDALYEQAIAEKNDSLRYLLYQQMDRVIVDEAPVVPLWYDMVVRLVQPNVSGFNPTAANMLELRTVRKN